MFCGRRKRESGERFTVGEAPFCFVAEVRERDERFDSKRGTLCFVAAVSKSGETIGEAKAQGALLFCGSSKRLCFRATYESKLVR